MSSKAKKLSQSNELIDSLTPQRIVEELDRFIVGQQDAKKAVAISLRNRIRRKLLPADLIDEVVPKNILMIGPTGVGKTEIARRLAKLVNAPFIKVEATKFTEIGYVGRDVESIIRDLVESAVVMTRNNMRKSVEKQAKAQAEKKIVAALTGADASKETKEKFLKMLQDKQLDDSDIDIELSEQTPSTSPLSPMFDVPGMPGAQMQMGVLNINDILGKAFGGAFPEKKKLVNTKVSKAFDSLMSEEIGKLIDEDKVIKAALNSVENEAIVFIDEIDKIAARDSKGSGGEVSREGVQRDLLPLIEGSCVSTKYGTVNTDHILFIASGAFHMSKPSDLLPELQGRLPIRVELKALSKEDMVRILTEPEASLIKQYKALLLTEEVELDFQSSAIDTIAKLAERVNTEVENIGARRLHTMMEKLLEDISFYASDKKGEKIKIDAKYVDDKLKDLVQQTDLSKFIL